MQRSLPRPSFANALAVLAGLLASQAAATVLVHRAALDLQQQMTAIIAAGYLAVPSPAVVQQLSGWSGAFMGALFFTASTGALISLLTLAAVRLAQRPLRAGILGALWATVAVFLNSTGLNPGATAYVAAVTAATAAAALATERPAQPARARRRRALVVCVPLLLLAGLWLTRLDRDLFVDIRDRLLLSNLAGVRIAAFYYDYTLFAACAMAPLVQQTLIGVDMSALAAEPDGPKLVAALRRRDVLDIGNASGAAAVLAPEAETVRWRHAAGRSVSASRKELLRHPEAVLEIFSRTVDRNGPFRLLTLAGLLAGFPVLLYAAMFTGIEAALGCLRPRQADVAAAAACLAVGAALLLALTTASRNIPAAGTDPDLLERSAPSERISVLREAARRRIDPLRYRHAAAIAESSRVAERYWFARALAGAASLPAFPLLERMMNDPSPLVVCQACYALGELKNPKAVALLLNRIENGNHWYTQRYTYAALRKLGWTQPSGCR